MSDALNRRFSGPVHVKDQGLTFLLSRLEAATSRLEDIASSAAAFEPSTQTNGGASTSPVPPPSGPQTVPTPQKPVQEELPQSIEDFDTLLNGDLKKWMDLSHALGDVVAEQVRELLVTVHDFVVTDETSLARQMQYHRPSRRSGSFCS